MGLGLQQERQTLWDPLGGGLASRQLQAGRQASRLAGSFSFYVFAHPETPGSLPTRPSWRWHSPRRPQRRGRRGAGPGGRGARCRSAPPGLQRFVRRVCCEVSERRRWERWVARPAGSRSGSSTSSGTAPAAAAAAAAVAPAGGAPRSRKVTVWGVYRKRVRGSMLCSARSDAGWRRGAMAAAGARRSGSWWRRWRRRLAGWWRRRIAIDREGDAAHTTAQAVSAQPAACDRGPGAQLHLRQQQRATSRLDYYLAISAIR